MARTAGPHSGLDRILMQYTSPSGIPNMSGFKPLVPYGNNPNAARINRQHPYFGNCKNMLYRVHDPHSAHKHVHFDPAFIGTYFPSHSNRWDKYAWFAYVYIVDVLLGPKPFSTPGASDFEFDEASHALCVDRRDTTRHYTAYNMRWLPDAENASNSILSKPQLKAIIRTLTRRDRRHDASRNAERHRRH